MSFGSPWALPDRNCNCDLQITIGNAWPQPPDLNQDQRALPAPDLSEHCQTSTASSRALLNLKCERHTSVGSHQPPALDVSGHCRTSTASSRSQWALLDLNCELQISSELQITGAARPQMRAPDLSGHCQTSTGSQWALGVYVRQRPYVRENVRIDAKIKCGNRCQKQRQNRCQIECQKDCRNRY